jgi:hypothetical protein
MRFSEEADLEEGLRGSRVRWWQTNDLRTKGRKLQQISATSSRAGPYWKPLRLAPDLVECDARRKQKKTS